VTYAHQARAPAPSWTPSYPSGVDPHSRHRGGRKLRRLAAVCGRFALGTFTFGEVASLLRAQPSPAVIERFRPSYNVAPTDEVLGATERNDERRMDLYRWGLVPSWSKDPRSGVRSINARAETVRDKPLFRAAFEKRRLLIPASGYFEWQATGRHKQPYYFTRRDGEPMIFAGLYEAWRATNDDPWLLTCAIIVGPANEEGNDVHDRMPIVSQGSSASAPAQRPLHRREHRTRQRSTIT